MKYNLAFKMNNYKTLETFLLSKSQDVYCDQVGML